ncbi:hypothetical protein PHMEG_0005666 [Phytophthora megakarya]|uniref:Uncharacterized protein n=1 Tax=Phytophthora megakarya TaxID=4795 RepID=A0A225WSF5_9STRA|nr:hypothetical protein PHMEG_0005666 [Phytophthora megakarya]
MQDATEKLEEMIKSTHQLDEILQHLCAEWNGSGEAIGKGGENDSSDVEFEDCEDCASEREVTAEEYFESVRKVFGSSDEYKLQFAPCPLDPRQLAISLDADLAGRFTSCTRDTSFVFTLPRHFGMDGVSTEVPTASSPSDYNMSYPYFLSRLRKQIVGCDHIVPVQCADTAARLAFLLLEEQQRRLLGAISIKFPYNRESIYWVQGNRVCERD